jgi:glycosyltransferase involved in cell wall biosynthesis
MLVHGQPSSGEEKKQNCGTLPWAEVIENRYFRIAGTEFVWQPVLREAIRSDLVVATQENRILVNYVLQTVPRFLRPKFAFWGHGRNFQASAPEGLAQRWKRKWATKCDWWFAYTDQTRRIVEGYGFPSERITVFNNAIDTGDIGTQWRAIGAEELLDLKKRLEITSDQVAIFVGGLYHLKRLPFLIAAAEIVQRAVPEFILLIVGGGEEQQVAEAAAAKYSFIRYLGPRFGREKVALLKLAKIFVMPGLVGLSILDSAAAGLPVLTTRYPFHSPEICYLEPGRNGLIVEDWQSPSAFAQAMVSVLTDDEYQSRLVQGAKSTAETYTIEGMADRFCDGVRAALATPALRV